MINSNKKQEYLQKWEPILTNLGVDPQFHTKLALYAEQHISKVHEYRKDQNLSDLAILGEQSITYALTVLSKLKDINKVMIVDSLEGSVGNFDQKILVDNEVGVLYDNFIIYDLINILNGHIDADKIVCVQFLFHTIQTISEPSLKTQINYFHNYMVC